jgi:hypothetical protein
MTTYGHGRKSAASLSVFPRVGQQRRPEPPSYLSDDESEVWRSIVDSMPPNHFGAETWPMLCQLCSHTVTSKLIRRALHRTPKRVADLHELLTMNKNESKIITELSHKLRLTPASRKNSRKAEVEHRHGTTKRPWERSEETEEDAG